MMSLSVVGTFCFLNKLLYIFFCIFNRVHLGAKVFFVNHASIQ